MKKALITIFSISVTAGTLFLTYSQLKDYLIKKQLKYWAEESKKQKKDLSELQLKQLKEELEKLYLWEIKLLANYWGKANAQAGEKELAPMIKKIKEKKILERTKLKSIDGILFGT